MVAAPALGGSVNDQEHEIALRLLTFDIRLQVPAASREPFEARFVTPADQDAPVRTTWSYRVAAHPDGRLELWEGADRFAEAPDLDAAAELLEERILGRGLDHFARWGWLVVAGRLSAAGGRRAFTVGRDDGARTLVRDGEAVALPLPLPFTGALPARGPLTEVEVVGAPEGPLPVPAAMSALLDAATTPIPGGARAAVREVTAICRGVTARGIAADRPRSTTDADAGSTGVRGLL
jgi:hypothetical protein